jgi:hypothetical protein
MTVSETPEPWPVFPRWPKCLYCPSRKSRDAGRSTDKAHARRRCRGCGNTFPVLPEGWMTFNRQGKEVLVKGPIRPESIID